MKKNGKITMVHEIRWSGYKTQFFLGLMSNYSN